MKEDKRKCYLFLLIEENFYGIKYCILWFVEFVW